jgi:hypothetical protein
MDIGKAIVTLLSGYSVYPVVAPQGTTGNYIVYQVISYLPSKEKALSTLDVAMVQLTFITSTYAQGITMAKGVRTILDGAKSFTDGGFIESIRFEDSNDLFDLETRGYILSNTYTFRINTNFIDLLQDQDGNVYNTVEIGGLAWTIESWRCTKYSDGTNIPLVTVNADWEALTTGAYCEYGTPDI